VDIGDRTESRVSAKLDEYCDVDQNAAKKAEKDPEVVMPKTLILIGDINPTI
jgi:hypothetical protein